jgi:hypothetical protein
MITATIIGAIAIAVGFLCWLLHRLATVIYWYFE